MKSYKYFLEEVSNEMKVGCFDLSLITELAAQRYALQLCEDLRERCADNAEVHPTGKGGYEVHKESILETEIILP